MLFEAVNLAGNLEHKMGSRNYFARASIPEFNLKPELFIAYEALWNSYIVANNADITAEIHEQGQKPIEGMITLQGLFELWDSTNAKNILHKLYEEYPILKKYCLLAEQKVKLIFPG